MYICHLVILTSMDENVKFTIHDVHVPRLWGKGAFLSLSVSYFKPFLFYCVLHTAALSYAFQIDKEKWFS